MSKLITEENTSAKNKGRIAATITALIIFLCLYFVTFSSVNKWVDKTKKPKEKGVIINFGSTDKGMGEVQKQEVAKSSDLAKKASELNSENIVPLPSKKTKVELPQKKQQPLKKVEPKPAKKKTSPSKTEAKKVVTQKTETKTIPPKTKPTPKKKVTTPAQKPEPKLNKDTDTKPEAKVDEQQSSKPIANEVVKSDSNVDEKGSSQQKATPTINNRALYPGKKNIDSPGEGSTNTQGDQGVQTGSEKKGRYTGTASGVGDSGVKHTIADRKIIKKPTIQDNSNVQGVITVNIKVGRDGNVIAASIGRPTTISNNTILQKSIQAAKRTKFNESPRAAIEQFGTMTFEYKVR